MKTVALVTAPVIVLLVTAIYIMVDRPSSRYTPEPFDFPTPAPVRIPERLPSDRVAKQLARFAEEEEQRAREYWGEEAREARRLEKAANDEARRKARVAEVEDAWSRVADNEKQLERWAAHPPPKPRVCRYLSDKVYGESYGGWMALRYFFTPQGTCEQAAKFATDVLQFSDWECAAAVMDLVWDDC